MILKIARVAVAAALVGAAGVRASPGEALLDAGLAPADVLDAGGVEALDAGVDALEVADAGPAPLAEDAGAPDAGARTATRETVVRANSAGDRLRESAQPVLVVDTTEAKRQSADLGEVLARNQGVGVRRGGGLGSATRFSLNGLTDDQIRFFLDGVPLDLAGYPFGIANVPLAQVERVEVYRGVVPIKLGADALGGAVNLVSEQDVRGARASASYQAGSFGTHRFTASARWQPAQTSLFMRATAFADRADNDFPIDVEVPDPRPATRGQLIPARVYRFHDGYRAFGGTAEVGFVNAPFARRLILKGFVNDFRRDLQTNPSMEVPYGEVTFGRLSSGANLRYQHRFGEHVRLDAVGGYAWSRTDFLDVATCIYDWYGRCTLERQRPGEVGEARDETLDDHAGFVRAQLEWNLSSSMAVRLSLSPTFNSRRGVDRIKQFSAIVAERELFSFVGGLEHWYSSPGERFENSLFAKGYFQTAFSREPVSSGVDRELSRALGRGGVGDALRVRIVEGFFAKASYEFATRLPRVDELFGDAVLTNPNPELTPETSHNVNLGVTLNRPIAGTGQWRADLNGFLRETDNLIVLLPAFGDRFRNENVLAARSLGAEGSAGWTSPGEYVSVDLNGTFFDFRNVRAEGALAPFEGDRIPNRPFLFANAAIMLQKKGLFFEGERLSLTWNTRFVGEFFEFWESAGTRQSKRTVPAQLSHSVALTWLVAVDARAFSVTAEVQNLTDARLYDFYGAQRPGRAVFFKLNAEL